MSKSGDIINLKLKVVHKTDKKNITLIRPDKGSKDGIVLKKIDDILQAMEENKKDNPHMQHVDRELTMPELPNYASISHVNSYEYDNLYGVTLRINSKLSRIININPSFIKLYFPNIVNLKFKTNIIYVIYKK